MRGLTRAVGEYAAGLRFADVPAAALSTIKNGLSDYAGVVLLGRDQPVTSLIRSFVSVVPGGGEARLCFGPDGAAAPEAALVNGVAGHALDYDDVGLEKVHPTHPTVVLASALLAEAEALGRSGADVLAAYAAGYEVWGELGSRDRIPHHVKGWHPTATFGALAAAAACANLRRLDAERAAAAVALAASQAGGIVANFGTMAKPFHAGRAAQVGVLSARLAEAGMTAGKEALENPKGFLAAVSPRGEVDLESPPGFGARWWLLDSPLGFKVYPMCYGTHRALAGMLALKADPGFAPGDVAEMIIEATPTMMVPLVNHDPRTALDGKFSMEFALAMAALAGRATLAEVTDEFVRRDDVRALMKTVRIVLLDEPAPGGPRPQDRVTVVLRDGRRLARDLDVPPGHASRPPTREALWAKFADCTRAAMGEAEARRLFDRLQDFETLSSVAELPAVSTGPRRRAS